MLSELGRYSLHYDIVNILENLITDFPKNFFLPPTPLKKKQLGITLENSY